MVEATRKFRIDEPVTLALSDMLSPRTMDWLNKNGFDKNALDRIAQYSINPDSLGVNAVLKMSDAEKAIAQLLRKNQKGEYTMNATTIQQYRAWQKTEGEEPGVRNAMLKTPAKIIRIGEDEEVAGKIPKKKKQAEV